LASWEIVFQGKIELKESEDSRYIINKKNNNSNIMIDEAGNDKDNIRNLNNNMYITYQEGIIRRWIKMKKRTIINMPKIIVFSVLITIKVREKNK